jgi:hypothetical protein
MKSLSEMTDEELREAHRKYKQESELQNILQEALKVLK